jgi:PAS domain S-box-containing protein
MWRRSCGAIRVLPVADARRRAAAASRWIPVAYLALGLLWIFGSDRLMGVYFAGSPDLMLHVGTVKGVIFVTLTAVLLYVVISTRPGVADAPADTDGPSHMWRPIVAFVIFGAPVALAGFLIYMASYQSYLDDTSAALTAEADLSARAVQLWIDSHVRGVRQLVASPLSADVTADTADSGPAGPALRQRLEAVKTSQGFVGVQVFAADHSVIAGAGTELPVDPTLGRAIDVALQANAGDVGVYWPAAQANHRPQHVDFVARFGSWPRSKVSGVGVVVARANAAELTGLLAAPALLGLRTGVTLLVTPDGTSVRYLSREGAGALHAAWPVARRASRELASVQLITGAAGPFQAVDEFGTPVLATGRPVAGTTWFVLNQVNMSEIETAQRQAFMLAWGLGAAGLALVAALVLLWWRNEQARFALRIHQEQTRADMATQRFAMISRHAGDVMLLLEEDGRIADVNQCAAEVYGCLEADLVGRTIFDLQADDVSELKLVHAGSEHQPGRPPLRFETRHQRHDGTPFPVEVCATRVDFRAHSYVLCIVRDISERRAHEIEIGRLAAERNRLLHRLRLQFDAMPIACAFTDMDDALVDVNPAFERLFGYERAYLQGPAPHNLIFPPEVREYRSRIMAALSSGCEPITTTVENLTRGGLRLTCRWTVAAMREPDGAQIGILAMCQDVSDTVAAEAALRANDEQLKTAQRLAQVGSWEVDLATMRITSSDETYRICGVSRSEFAGTLEAGFALVHPDDRPTLQDRFASIAAGEERIEEARFRVLRPSGDVVHVSARGRLERDAMGRPRRLVASLHNISAIVVAQRHAERQRDLYGLLVQCNQLIARSSEEGKLYRDLTALVVNQGHYLFAWLADVDSNGVMRRVAAFGDDGGYIEALLAADAAGAHDPEPPCVSALRAGRTKICNELLGDPGAAFAADIVRARGINAVAAIPIKQAGAGRLALLVYGSEPDTFDPQSVTALADLADDVSFGVQAMVTRRALDEKTRLLQTVIDSSDSPIHATDAAGRILLVNEAWLQVIGQRSDTAVGRPLDDVLPTDAASLELAIDRRVLESGLPRITEARVPVDGAETLWLVTKFPLRSASREVYGVGSIAVDVTGMRRMEDELVEANRDLEARIAVRTSELAVAKERAERADRTKSAFLSTMSHELRTPLNSVLGFTDILLDGLSGPLNEEQQRQLGIVKGASLHLLELINDVLDISRVEAGELRLELSEVDVVDVLRTRVRELTPLAERKGIVLVCKIADPVVPIHSDRRRVSQIIGNLLSNAVKFTDSGQVSASIRLQGSWINLAVQDTGCGVQPEDLDKLFVPFAQLKRKPEAANEGTGLGLAISRHFARALGGDISVQSEPSVGSCFTVMLPLSTPEKVDLASTGIFRRVPPQT